MLLPDTHRQHLPVAGYTPGDRSSVSPGSCGCLLYEPELGKEGNAMSRYWSVRNLLVTVCCFMILLPYVLTGAYYIVSMMKQLEYGKQLQLQNSMENMDSLLADVLEETRRISCLPMMDPDISRILRAQYDADDTTYHKDQVWMERVLRDVISVNPAILSVAFYSTAGSVYYASHSSSVRDAEDPAWMALVGQAEDGCHVAPVRRNQSGDLVLPVSYALYDSLSDECIGYAQMDYSVDALLSSCRTWMNNVPELAVLCEQTILYDSGGLVDSAEELTLMEDVAEHVRLKGRDYLGLLSVDSRTGLCFFVYQNADVFSSNIMQSIMLYLALLGMMLILAMAVSFFFIGRISNSIRDLSMAMDNAQHGEIRQLQVEDHILIHTELEGLRQSYNAMITRLHESAEREAAARLEQKNAEIRMLESQIHPHFLYNTLNLIASLAELEHVPSVQTIAENLAFILRYAVRGDSMVSISEMLREAEAYVGILRMRYPDRLSVTTEVQPEVMECMVPKLILQPILENSVKYCAESRSRTLRIAIRILAEDGQVRLQVEDNGPGIRPDRLRQLRAQISEYEPDKSLEGGSSIGLINVHARIRSRFGVPYGLEIPDTDTGCVIDVRIPRLDTLNAAGRQQD